MHPRTHPLRPPLPNQGGNNTPLLQPGILGNPHQNPMKFNNQPQLAPQFQNPQFQINFPTNPQGSSFGAFPQPGQLFPQDPATVQQALALLQTVNLASQLHQGGLSWAAPNVVQNLMGMLNGQLGPQSHMMQGNQMMPFQGPPQNNMGSLQFGLPSNPTMGYGMGNPQLGQNNLNAGFGNQNIPAGAQNAQLPSSSNMMQNQWNRNNLQTGAPQNSQNNLNAGFGNSNVPVGTPAGAQNAQLLSSSAPMQSYWNRNNMQPGVHENSQVKHRTSSAIPGGFGSRNFTKNFHGLKNDSSHNRFQQRRFQHTRNLKGNMRPFTKNSERGQQNWKERKQQFRKPAKEKLKKSVEEAVVVTRRPIRIKYSEHEIRQWREARKRNFPRAKEAEKSIRKSNDHDANVKLCRQQMKDVLAKQEQLGVEIAEIPPNYLSDTEGKSVGVPAARSSIVKREPSLLRKLLSSDIKRDRSRVLQVFRFMVLNDFFEQYPEKPLVFPTIRVKGDAGYESEEDNEKDPSAEDEAETGFSVGDSDSHGDEEKMAAPHPMEEEDSVHESVEKLEEGEITE